MPLIPSNPYVVPPAPMVTIPVTLRSPLTITAVPAAPMFPTSSATLGVSVVIPTFLSV